MEGRVRELALFNLGIDSKLRGCDFVALKVRDVCHGDQVSARAVVMQHKTKRPVQWPRSVRLLEGRTRALANAARQPRPGVAAASLAANNHRKLNKLAVVKTGSPDAYAPRAAVAEARAKTSPNPFLKDGYCAPDWRVVMLRQSPNRVRRLPKLVWYATARRRAMDRLRRAMVETRTVGLRA